MSGGALAVLVTEKKNDREDRNENRRRIKEGRVGPKKPRRKGKKVWWQQKCWCIDYKYFIPPFRQDLDFNTEMIQWFQEGSTVGYYTLTTLYGYWNNHRDLVNKTLNMKRGNVNNELKKGFMSA